MTTDTEKRYLLFTVIFFFIFIFLEVYLFKLTVLEHEENPLNKQLLASSTLLRGTIYSSDRDSLAISIPFYSIYIDPTLADLSKSIYYQKFFSFFGISQSKTMDILHSKKKFRWIVRMLPKKPFLLIKENNLIKLPGISAIQEYKRIYPYQNLGGSIIGFNNLDGEGMAGLEYSLNKYLQPAMTPKSNHTLGYDVVLTINKDLEAKVEKTMADTAIELNPESMSSIIMEADTGKVLTMASYPDFDPNIYNTYTDPSVFINNNISSIDEPGSTFKPLVMTYLFDNHLIKDTDRFYSPGHAMINGFMLKEATGAALGNLSPREILMKSSNIGMAKASQGLTREQIYNLFLDIGLGKKTDISLPGEAIGIIRTPKEMTERSRVSLPIGQEVGITPIQLVQAFSAIANDGNLVKPHIIDHFEYQGQTVPLTLNKQQPPFPVYSAENAQRILSYMRDVVTHGSARRASIKGEWIAAKTGTAQIFDTKKGKYDKLNTSVMAIYKSSLTHKKYIIYAVIRDPKVSEKIAYGGTLAAPMVHDFIESLISTLKTIH